jgi:D-galactosamine 6-phosphate deaminase/isomerase
MSAFLKLLELSDEEKSKLGVVDTPREIKQQPDTWMKAVKLILEQKGELQTFLAAAGLTGEQKSTLLLCGAGSSEYIGSSVCNILRKGFGREVMSIPTAHMVTHGREFLVEENDYTILSFARSGNSPESVGTYEAVKKYHPKAKQLVITCNKDGALAKKSQADSSSYCILLPEETNDSSLVMTSSFSTMAMVAASLPWLDDEKYLLDTCRKLGEGTTRVFSEYGDMLADFGSKPFERACYLGSNTLFGTMEECQLKMQEMTDGQVTAKFESFLGLRHGPQVFVDDKCMVVASLSSNPSVRRYEMDMLKELKEKDQGMATLIVCDRADENIRSITENIVELFPEGTAVEDQFRIMTDVTVGQILGTFKSMDLGLKPDCPSVSGVINRVVQGVTIYDI